VSDVRRDPTQAEAAARADGALVVLVLAAAALVIAAPVAGRAGLPRLADALMLLAAGAGIASFASAAWQTARAARHAPPAGSRTGASAPADRRIEP
jgi:uncharacterized protein (DUF2345 family)